MYSKDWGQALTLKNKMSYPYTQHELIMFFKLNHLTFHLDPLEGTSLNQAIPEITSEITQRIQQKKKLTLSPTLKTSKPHF